MVRTTADAAGSQTPAIYGLALRQRPRSVTHRGPAVDQETARPIVCCQPKRRRSDRTARLVGGVS